MVVLNYITWGWVDSKFISSSFYSNPLQTHEEASTYLGNTHYEFIPSIQNLVLSISWEARILCAGWVCWRPHLACTQQDTGALSENLVKIIFNESQQAWHWVLRHQSICSEWTTAYTWDTQNPGFSAFTQYWVLHTWDELIITQYYFQVGKPLHELISTLNLFKLNFDSTFSKYVWGVFTDPKNSKKIWV